MIERLVRIGGLALIVFGFGALPVTCLRQPVTGQKELTALIKAEDVQLVVRNLKDDGVPWQFTASGYAPITKLPVSYSPTMGRWSDYIVSNLELGDTLVKKAGELRYLIKKKGQDVVLPFEPRDAPQPVLKLVKKERLTADEQMIIHQ
jgi:hypothetical protein